MPKVLDECYHGLGRRGLIDRDALMGTAEFLIDRGLPDDIAPGICYMLEPFGADLILWVSGHSGLTSHSFLRQSVRLAEIPEIPLPNDARKGQLAKRLETNAASGGAAEP
jgi:hypothetical protein